jgi:hypothetical protein
MTIHKFAILGERCSGTNFLEESIKQNFHINYTTEHGNKHFFCFNDYTKKNNDDTLFIGIIRNPIYWLNSLSKELHHIPNVNKNIRTFLFNEFYSILDNQPVKNKNVFNFTTFTTFKNYETVNPADLNYTTGQKYKNIFELRKLKNFYLTNIIQTKVKHYILINYEDLLYNYDDTLKRIKDKFSLLHKSSEFIKITNYKKSTSYSYKQQRLISFSNDLIKIIWEYLDKEQESNIGYSIEDCDNNHFKNKLLLDKLDNIPEIVGR